jgi:hypothetical protein
MDHLIFIKSFDIVTLRIIFKEIGTAKAKSSAYSSRRRSISLSIFVPQRLTIFKTKIEIDLLLERR